MSSFGNSRTRPHEPPMPDPLAFFLTWTTYGTWLPGDERGWVMKGHGFQQPQPRLEAWAKQQMTEAACVLDDEQRQLVEKTICDHCEIRKWELFAVSCRTNHVHVVVAANRDPEEVREQFKAWCTRRLKGYRYAPSDTQYWEHGQSTERDFIFVTTQNLNQLVDARIASDNFVACYRQLMRFDQQLVLGRNAISNYCWLWD